VLQRDERCDGPGFTTWINLPADQESQFLADPCCRFQVLAEEWSENYAVRTITNVRILDSLRDATGYFQSRQCI
jgi:hypothetical protein